MEEQPGLRHAIVIVSRPVLYLRIARGHHIEPRVRNGLVTLYASIIAISQRRREDKPGLGRLRAMIGLIGTDGRAGLALSRHRSIAFSAAVG